MLHIHRIPTDVEWRTCVHKPTVQRFAVLENYANVETVGGTIPGRPGDYLMVGVRGEMYLLHPADFQASYDILEGFPS